MNKKLFATLALISVMTLFGTISALADELPGKDLKPEISQIQIKFLGTGAADWKKPEPDGSFRRLTSILVNNKILIDFTASDKDMLPEGFRPDAIFYTHSHNDHFSATEILKLGVDRIYLGETWIRRAKRAFAKASEELGIAVPEIIPVKVGGRYIENGLVFLALPGNHATGDNNEQALIYLLESTTSRVLYATDTAGLTGLATRISGIDGHVKNGTPINGLIMEATIGLGHEDDYRYFNHSSVAVVSHIVKILTKTKRYLPKEGQYVYLTHLARTLHPSQDELDKTLPAPLKAAYDGLTVDF